MENPTKMDDLGVPLVLETTMCEIAVAPHGPLLPLTEARHGHPARPSATASNGSPRRNGPAAPGPPATSAPRPGDRGRPPSVGVRNLGSRGLG